MLSSVLARITATGDSLLDRRDESPVLSRFADTIESLLDRLDERASAKGLFIAVLFILLILLWPFSWNANEEAYFLPAYRHVAPQAFAPFHAAFDHSNARFLFEYLIGSLIAAFGYDATHTISRFSLAFLYAVSLSILFNALGLSILRAWAVLAIFCTMGEAILGGEWLFLGVESKTVAYTAVISAIGCGLNGRWRVATALVVIATYLHFLVGGFWGISLVALAFLQARTASQPLRILSAFLLCILPLLVLVALEQYSPAVRAIGPTTNLIYAARVPHHIAPFSSLHHLLLEWSTGIVTCVAMTTAFLVLTIRRRNSALLVFVCWLLLYLCAAVAVSFFDRNTLVFAKFYLFRPSSMTLLLALCVLLSHGFQGSLDTSNITLRLTLSVVVAVFVWTRVKDDVSRYENIQTLPDLSRIVQTIEKESRPGEIVLIEPRRETDFPYVGLPRRIPRPTLVSWELAPTNPNDLLRWHDLLEFRRAVFEGRCDNVGEYPVRLLLVFSRDTFDAVKKCGTLVWAGQSGYLVRRDDF